MYAHCNPNADLLFANAESIPNTTQIENKFKTNLTSELAHDHLECFINIVVSWRAYQPIKVILILDRAREQ